MERIARVIVHRSRVVLGATAVVTLLAVSMLFRLSLNADVSSFLLEGNATGEQFAALQDRYETQDPINVVASLPDGQTLRTSDNLARVAELRATLRDVDGVGEVASVVPETNPVTGGELDAASLRGQPDAVAVQVLERSPVSELLVSADAQHTLLIVTADGDLTGTARRVTDVTAPNLELTFSGNPVVFASVIDALSVVLLVIPPIVIALLVAVFFATIGDRRLSVLAIVPAILGSVWTFGLVFGLGFEIDVVTVIVPIFVIVMGSADGLHFVTHYQQESERTDDAVERVGSTLSQVGVPMILTTVSTAAGFLSLVATDVEPIRQLGLFTSAGIVFAGIVSFFSLPALLSRLHLRARTRPPILGRPVIAGLKALVRTRIPATVLTIGIVAFAVVAVPRLEVNADQLFFFEDNDPVRQAFERTEELFGGATPLIGEFVFDPTSPEASLRAARATSAELEQLDGVREVFSVAELADQLPPAQLDAVLSGEQEVALGKMASEDGLRFLLLPGDFTTADLNSWLAFAEQRDEIRVLTGLPVVWDEIARLVLDAQVTSLIVAYLLVAALLAFAYRRWWETLISLVPITLTIATLLGFIAVSGMQLNLLTAVVSSIVLGVGIDYVVHYVAAINHARPAGDGHVLRAIDRAGPPIAANALGIAIALSALWLSPLKIHTQLSQIMWIAMLTAGMTSLLVVPALLPRAAVREPQQAATSPAVTAGA
ncbi:MAG: MMPL family transporter [Actinobacteria bacterium]|nr:MMPL family transporter [Actinomycetota bacterium]